MKGSNSRAWSSGAMPIPVSWTVKRSAPSCPAASAGSTRRQTEPAAVNLIPLPTRLSRTCRNRAASPQNRPRAPGAASSRSSMPFSRAAGSSRRTTWSSVSARSNSNRSRDSWPGFDLGQVEDVVDQSPQGLRRGLDDVQGLAEIGGELGGEEQLRHADHAVRAECGSRGSRWPGTRSWRGSPPVPPRGSAASPPAARRSRRRGPPGSRWWWPSPPGAA